jgi:predicted DsbA family dithiol-disulfide isomerase
MKIEIWSDIVCPWCYIGKRRFERALSDFAHRDNVEVVWRSFELDPHAPRHSDESPKEVLARKYGMSLAEAEAAEAHMTAMAAQEGLDYRFDRAQRGNSFDAHRLLHLARERGVQDAMKERLLGAYFTEGLPIADVDTLVRLAEEVGIDRAEARAVLEGEAYGDAVRADERRARLLGISGVPFFVLDSRYGISGAQSPQVIVDALERAWIDTHPLVTVGAGDGACEGDNCAL